MLLNSGMKRDTGSARRTLPSSTIISTAAAVIGLDVEARRKMPSFGIGFLDSTSIRPCASRWTILPRRATSVTAPDGDPASRCRFTASRTRASRSAENPASSGLPTTSVDAPSGSSTATTATSVETTRTLI